MHYFYFTITQLNSIETSWKQVNLSSRRTKILNMLFFMTLCSFTFCSGMIETLCMLLVASKSHPFHSWDEMDQGGSCLTILAPKSLRGPPGSLYVLILWRNHAFSAFSAQTEHTLHSRRAGSLDQVCRFDQDISPAELQWTSLSRAHSDSNFLKIKSNTFNTQKWVIPIKIEYKRNLRTCIF